jgi:hypothetical protein
MQSLDIVHNNTNWPMIEVMDTDGEEEEGDDVEDNK